MRDAARYQGQPFAFFPDTDCDINSHFGPHNLIINLTFCGDWAGAVFDSDGCPGDCASAFFSLYRHPDAPVLIP